MPHVVSQRTKDIAKHVFAPMCSDDIKNVLSELNTNQDIDRNKLIGLLNKLKQNQKTVHSLPVQRLRASLLSDLRTTFSVKADELSAEGNKPLPVLLFTFIWISATFWAICEGYDGILSLLPLLRHFFNIPTWVTQVALCLFSVLSVMVLYAFDLMHVSKNLSVKFSEAPKLLDVLAEQAQEINLLRKYIKKAKDKGHLDELLTLTNLLVVYQKELDAIQKQYQEKINRPWFKYSKLTANLITGFLQFSGGFFLSQIPVIKFYAFLGLTLTATALPVILSSTVVGLGAIGVYWFMQRPDVDVFIANRFGLSVQKINALSNDKVYTAPTELRSGVQRIETVIMDLNEAKKRNLPVDTSGEGSSSSIGYKTPAVEPSAKPFPVTSHLSRRSSQEGINEAFLSKGQKLVLQTVP